MNSDGLLHFGVGGGSPPLAFPSVDGKDFMCDMGLGFGEAENAGGYVLVIAEGHIKVWVLS